MVGITARNGNNINCYNIFICLFTILDLKMSFYSFFVKSNFLFCRFIGPGGGRSDRLKDIHTKNLIPVELNSYLCRSARIMSSFYEKLGKPQIAESYRNWGNSVQEAIENILWNETHGAWFDYNIIQGSQRTEKENFYPSNIAPLWAECYQ